MARHDGVLREWALSIPAAPKRPGTPWQRAKPRAANDEDAGALPVRHPPPGFPNRLREEYARAMPRIPVWRKVQLRRLRAEGRTRGRRRYAALGRASLSWADQEAMAQIYAFRDACTEVVGVPYHVDHIVPLLHPLVCGLHVAANLRVIPGTENVRKGNRWWPDMPEGVWP